MKFFMRHPGYGRLLAVSAKTEEQAVRLFRAEMGGLRPSGVYRYNPDKIGEEKISALLAGQKISLL